ncbi:MAG: response regulator [Acidobacteria bacterium]|nr:response regulator [Acidobacteriota bacterium]
MDDSAGRRPTILIVEDVDWIRAGMRRSVESHGYRAVEASDLVEAVELTERESPELILTEENFPSFDAIIEYVRERRALRRVPVVVVNPDSEEGARHGDARVLTSYEQIAPLLTSPR